MTPEQRVTAAIDCTPYAKATPDAIHHHPRERTTRMTTPTNPPAGDMTAPSEGRRTRLGEVIYGAMFEVQIDLRYGGAEKAEYIADAVRRALEEAEPGDHPDSEGDNVPSLAPALTERDREAEVEQLRRSRDTWARVEAETRAEMHARLAEHRDAVEVLKLRLSEVATERDRARSVAVALEAEVERLRAGIEERVVGWSSYRTDPASLTAASCAESLRRLLTPPDAQEPAQEPRTGAGGPGVPDEGCEAVSGQQWGVVEAPQDGGE